MKLYSILTISIGIFCLLLVSVPLSIARSSLPYPLQLKESLSYRHELSAKSIKQDIKPLADLPSNVVPKSYNIKLRPIIDPNEGTGEQWTAPGHVDIQIQPIETTSQIVLHRRSTLTIHEDDVTITGSNGAIVKVTNHTFSDADEFHTFNLDGSIIGGQTYTLSIGFTAPIAASSSGLYRAEYKDSEGKEYRLATTQFERSNARQAFPCFDEPRWKTPFTVSLSYKNKTYNTLSNSVKKTVAEPDPVLEDWVWDHFETTVLMPTYLVALTISNFDFQEAPEPVFGDRPVRIYGEPRYIAPGGNKDVGGARFAANASAHLLAYLEEKYVHKYEMPKMDSVAIPDPFFGPGAIENWGLNIYREEYLLFFDGEQSWADKQEILNVLNHELAHQWFGNLVTCKTWSNMWLNEGFATYVETNGVYELFPEFDELKRRLNLHFQYALNYDVVDTKPVYGTGQSGVMYYDKAGSLIRMMEGFLGEETLTKGLITYLKTLAYEAVEQDDLFSHLTAQAVKDKKLPEGKTVKDIMDTWTLQAGFPLIRVTKLVDSNNILITQERFQPATVSSEETYEVPISISTEDSAVFSNHTPAIWLSKDERLAVLEHDTSKWILVNPDAMGYYRVMYDDDLTELILCQLKKDRNAFSALSRSQLIDDHFAFYKHGHIPIEKALDMTTFLKNDVDAEGEYIVWSTLFTQLTKALAMFHAHNGGPEHSFRDYLLPTIEQAISKIGWIQYPSDKGTLVLHKAQLLDWACALGSEQCKTVASTGMSNWIGNDVNTFEVDVQAAMYCKALAVDTTGITFDFVYERFGKSPIDNFKTQRNKLFNALSCSTNTLNLQMLMDSALNKVTPIGKDVEVAIQLFLKLAANPVARTFLLDYLLIKYEVVSEALGGAPAIIRIVSELSKYLTREQQLQDVKTFIDFYKEDLGEKLDGALETIQSNIDWIHQNYDAMDAWFKSHSP